MKKILTAALAALALFTFSCAEEPETTGTQAAPATAAKTEEQTLMPLDEITEPGTETAETAEPVTETDAPSAGKTAAPVIKGYVLTEPGRAMVYGSCEKDGVITVTAAEGSFEAHADGVYFAVPASLLEKGKTEVRLTCRAAGKEESDPAAVTIKNVRNIDDTGVTVTLGSRVIEKKVLPDRYGTNAFSAEELEAVVNNVRYRLSIAAKTAGKQVKLVYVIAPDPLTVYPEEMTDEMKAQVTEPSKRMEQAVKALSSVEGVTVIDLTKTMTENRENGKLYYKLDSHWTELGAFYGYQTVMKTLGLPYRELSDYKVEYIDIDDTDMNVYSGAGTGEMYESAPFLSALFEEKTPYGKNKEDTARIWSFADEYFVGKISRTDSGSGPSALYLFDSYGFNLVPYLAESLGVFVTQPVWKYSVDYSLVSEIRPDYIIEILAERDLGELLSAT